MSGFELEVTFDFFSVHSLDFLVFDFGLSRGLVPLDMRKMGYFSSYVKTYFLFFSFFFAPQIARKRNRIANGPKWEWPGKLPKIAIWLKASERAAKTIPCQNPGFCVVVGSGGVEMG